MLKADDQTEWIKMYAYQSGPFIDLFDMMAEFLKECEHANFIAACEEISSDTVEDVKAWKKKRKEDRKSTRLNSSHIPLSRMPSSA